ncbi:MAG: hypothetical protein LPD71_00195 [Shewanella sp.]|nr:hypothetical protein [Shewanella sp.]MCF1457208.1 hypothetical protein [Shewanella sp.]
MKLFCSIASVCLVILAISGCASKPFSPENLYIEKVVLDWKDFYPSNFVSGCNKVHSLTGILKKSNRFCYRTDYRNSDVYSMIVDVTYFKPSYQLFFNEKDKNIHLPKVVNKLINYDCIDNIKRFHKNAYSCDLENGNNMFLVTNYVVGNGKVSEARLVLFPEKNTNFDNEYQTAMRIISNDNLKKFLTD